MAEELISVGIDIGTTTTQVIFSSLAMEDKGGYFTAPDISITNRKILYKSPIYFTPLKSLDILDMDAIQIIISKEYGKVKEELGITKEQVKTGAVIITGESAKKENAEKVLQSLSEFAGKFVVSTAGPDLESVIAGKGSGAYEYSKKNHCLVANLDIGGGTTNIVFFEDGQVIDKTCLDIGGRLLRVEHGCITYLAPTVQSIIKQLDLSLQVGDSVYQVNEQGTEHIIIEEIQQLSQSMAYIILATIDPELVGKEIFAWQSKLLETKAFITKDSAVRKNSQEPTAIFFSGGVADLQREQHTYFQYGDMGEALGEAIYLATEEMQLPVIHNPNTETIRATVIGAGMHTTEISGSTITCTCRSLPVKNVPVYYLQNTDICKLMEGQLDDVLTVLKQYLQQNDIETFCFGMKLEKAPKFAYLYRLAKAFFQLYQELHYEGCIFMIVGSDCAKALGQMMDQLFAYEREILCIDRVIVNDGDYVDFGEPMMQGCIIPVIVKTLLFSK